ncbi:hypothetical protein BD626DRAFT_515257 [Schizophyllum amplum]|uniref:BTB domain-containing protein n=1 Tax=Schizophyllum amplum TaxID=97359 RepID=A0A550BXP3_9AGAR|nr:hypothetical protein BD626DRAFT_515257 [Auriculariopsis ampla]
MSDSRRSDSPLTDPSDDTPERDRQCERFCSLDGGEIIILRSSDRVLFNIHRINLQITTDGPLAEDFPSAPEEIVQLTESADTLELLFQYVYRGRHPILDEISVTKLLDLAEAAEKYGVSAARSLCYVRLCRPSAHQLQPLQVMAYAHRHGYPHLLDLVAPLTIGMPISKVQDACSISLFFQWLRYNDAWVQLNARDCHEVRARDKHEGSTRHCFAWRALVYSVDITLSGHGLSMLTNLDGLFAMDALAKTADRCGDVEFLGARKCMLQMLEWKKLLEEKSALIPPLSQFQATATT